MVLSTAINTGLAGSVPQACAPGPFAQALADSVSMPGACASSAYVGLGCAAGVAGAKEVEEPIAARGAEARLLVLGAALGVAGPAYAMPVHSGDVAG